MNDASRIGAAGEDFTADRMKQRGYRILARNYQTRYGELDIIAASPRYIVFVEVKTRKNNNFGTPLEAITQTKLNNIKTGVFSYLQSTSHKYKNFRIDVIGITLQPALKIDHLKSI